MNLTSTVRLKGTQDGRAAKRVKDTMLTENLSRERRQ